VGQANTSNARRAVARHQHEREERAHSYKLVRSTGVCAAHCASS
jgi:hypothetical protein